MQRLLTKVPFFRLLLPLLGGIISQYYFYLQHLAVSAILLGIAAITVSFFIHPHKQYKWRWVFGIGCYFLLFSIGVMSTSIKQTQSAFTFSKEKAQYTGVIIDIPQTKPKTIACKVQLNNSDKKIICYLQSGVRSNKLEAGEEITFSGIIQPFKHFGNPSDFNYPQYMYNNGYSGLIFLYSSNWESTGQKPFTFLSLALQCRQSILNFYKSLDLNDEEYSLLSALTLGYKNDLSADLKQAFRATGTAHVLAVSGMHVGIIYGVVFSIFSLFGYLKKHRRTLQILIITIMWAYAFVTGLSPSVVRATIMLSIFCIAIIFRRKGFTYNNISLAAFLMLLINPFSLFDVGFQLSFAAVLSIRFLQPVLSGLFKLKNSLLRKTWELFTLSLAAQAGTLPICLYYFGTFPSYFFITNLLVVPLISVIFYAAISLLVPVLTANILPASLSEYIYYLPVHFLKLVISFMTNTVRFFESLPFALVENLKPSLFDTILLSIIILTGSLSLIHKRAKPFIYMLCVIFLISMQHLGQASIFRKSELTIYQNNNVSAVNFNTGAFSYNIDSITENKLTVLNGKKILSIISDEWKDKETENKYIVDYLHIVNGDSISLYSLTQTFSANSVIIDVSLSAKSRRQLINECEKLEIPYYDMSEKGVFRINF